MRSRSAANRGNWLSAYDIGSDISGTLLIAIRI
jgi:hypothetical protein